MLNEVDNDSLLIRNDEAQKIFSVTMALQKDLLYMEPLDFW
jgi:hypothetical protein